MAGSILAGWAVEAGRYRPRRWVRASCWAVAQTDSGGSGTGAGRGRERPGPGASAGCGLVMAGGSSGLGEDQQVGMDTAAAGQAGGAVGGGIGGELGVADGGVHQDDVLGVDQAGGAGAGNRLPGQVGELAVRGGGAAGDDREHPAGPPAQQPGPWQPVMARAARPASGSPAASSRAGTPGRSRANGRAAGSRRARSPAIARPSRTGAGIRPSTGRPPAAAASITAAEPSGTATRSPGRENTAMTWAAAWTVTGPAHGPCGPLRGAGSPGQMLSGTPGPVPPAAGPPGAVPCPPGTGGKAGPGPL